MTKEEIEALRAQMAQIEEESRRRLYAQMDRLSSDERMTDEEREALYAQIDEQLTYMRQTRDMLSQKLKLASAAVDEVETRLKEEQRDPSAAGRADQRGDRLSGAEIASFRAGYFLLQALLGVLHRLLSGRRARDAVLLSAAGPL